MTRAQLAAHTKRAADQCHRLQAELSDFEHRISRPAEHDRELVREILAAWKSVDGARYKIDTARTLMPLPKVQKMGSTKPSNRIRVQR